MKKRDPKITTLSVVTSFKEYSPLILETVESILGQQRLGADSVDYVIWNGGSRTSEIHELENRYGNRLRVIHQTDNGLYDSLASAFLETKGELLSYLNVGDIWSPTTARTVIDVFNDNSKVNWFCGLQCFYDKKGNLIATKLPFRFRQEFIESGLYGRRYCFPSIQQESTFWRRNLMELIDLEHFRGLKCAGDAYMWQSFSKTQDLYIVRVALGGFRKHDNHLSQVQNLYQNELKEFRNNFKIRFFPIFLFDKVMWRLPDRLRIKFAAKVRIEP
jgi:hypothetical protein